MDINEVEIPRQVMREIAGQIGQGVVNQLEAVAKPVLIINPRYSTIVSTNSSAVTGAATVVAAPGAGRKVCITSATLAYTKDGTCDLTATWIEITQGGTTKRLLTMHAETTTAGNDHAEMSYPFPVICDANTAVTLQGAFTVGTCTRRATITGFIVEER